MVSSICGGGVLTLHEVEVLGAFIVVSGRRVCVSLIVGYLL